MSPACKASRQADHTQGTGLIVQPSSRAIASSKSPRMPLGWPSAPRKILGSFWYTPTRTSRASASVGAASRASQHNASKQDGTRRRQAVGSNLNRYKGRGVFQGDWEAAIVTQAKSPVCGDEYLSTNGPHFSAIRMLRDYADQVYRRD